VKNVLVPVDGSANSLRAVRYMVDYVQENGPCAIHLLNVQLPIVSGTVLTFIDQKTIQEYYEDEAKAALSDAKALLDRSGIVYQAALRVGHTADTIKTYATEQQCDHIVMGSRGLGAAGSLLLGSVTLKVLHTIHIPVVLIN
jgi:nucleotide-binding universal stress UspA family protein